MKFVNHFAELPIKSMNDRESKFQGFYSIFRTD